MNPKEFINHRKNCPICEYALITNLISSKSSLVEEIDGHFFSYFTFNDKGILKFSSKRYGAFVFNREDLFFQVEFYETEKIGYDKVPFNWIKMFLEYHSHLGLFHFKRECIGCRRYSYESEQFPLNLKECSIPPLAIFKEQIYLTCPLPERNNVRVYVMDSFPFHNETKLYIYEVSSVDELLRSSIISSEIPCTRSDLPLIPFSTPEKMTQKLNDLLIYI